MTIFSASPWVGKLTVLSIYQCFTVSTMWTLSPTVFVAYTASVVSRFILLSSSRIIIASRSISVVSRLYRWFRIFAFIISFDFIKLGWSCLFRCCCIVVTIVTVASGTEKVKRVFKFSTYVCKHYSHLFKAWLVASLPANEAGKYRYICNSVVVIVSADGTEILHQGLYA